AVAAHQDVPRTDRDLIIQIDVQAADIYLEEIGVGLAYEDDVARGVARDVAGELGGRLRILQNDVVGETARRDRIAQVDPVRVQIQGQVARRPEHRAQRVVDGLLGREVGVAAGDGLELEAARGIVRIERR